MTTPLAYIEDQLVEQPAKELLAQFWKLDKEAEKMLEGLAR